MTMAYVVPPDARKARQARLAAERSQASRAKRRAGVGWLSVALLLCFGVAGAWAAAVKDREDPAGAAVPPGAGKFTSDMRPALRGTADDSLKDFRGYARELLASAKTKASASKASASKAAAPELARHATGLHVAFGKLAVDGPAIIEVGLALTGISRQDVDTGEEFLVAAVASYGNVEQSQVTVVSVSAEEDVLQISFQILTDDKDLDSAEGIAEEFNQPRAGKELEVLLAAFGSVSVGDIQADILPSGAPLAPTPCSDQIIDGTEDPSVTINEDDCKVWKVIGPLISLTVTSSSATLGEAVNVDVTFSGAGAVSSRLAVADGGNAKGTAVAAEGDISGVVVGRDGGTATNTNIAADSMGSVNVGRIGGTATNTNIAAADSVGNVYVGTSSGTATETRITASSVGGGLVYVGWNGGTATNTNIAADLMSNLVYLYVGFEGGTATDTTIAIAGDVAGNIIVARSGTATNTNIAAEGDIDGIISVSAFSGTATNTNIAVAGDVGSNVRVGGAFGTAINTNIAAGSFSEDVSVGFDGTAIDTVITIGTGGLASGKRIKVYSGATNTNVINNGPDPVTIFVWVESDPAETKCNGDPLPPFTPPASLLCDGKPPGGLTG